MRGLYAAVLIGMLGGPAMGQALPEAGVRGVISDQIAALKADDYARAFSYASPFIQGLFRTPGNFGAMVERGYPMVAAPRSVQFGALTAEGPLYYQDVTFEDVQGRFYTLEYEMLQAGDSFVINGVQLKVPPETGV